MILLTVISIVLISLLIYKKLLRNGKFRSVCCDAKVNESFDYDVAIVGSGISGSSLATVLARDGRKVVVVERNMKMPERFSGEIVQPRALKALEKLNLQECIENIDAQILGGYFIYGERGAVKVDLKYKSNGFSIINGRFVMNLRRAAIAESNVTYKEGNVVNFVESDDTITGIIYKSGDNQEETVITARLTIVADGCLSLLRKNLVNQKPKQLTSCFAGLVKNCDNVPTGEISVCLTKRNVVFMYWNDVNSLRVITDLKEKIPMKDFKSHFVDKIYPQLPERFKAAALEGMTVSKITIMPTHAMTANPKHKNGVFVLGDALNMRHPNTANGMTVAFCDVALLRNLLSEVKNLADYNSLSNIFKKFLKMRKKSSSVINIYSLFLNELYHPKNEGMALLQKAYAACTKFNDKINSEAVLFLTSMDTSIYSLLSHLISVSFYAICMPFNENSFKSLFRSINQSMSVIGTIVKVIIPLIWSEI